MNGHGLESVPFRVVRTTFRDTAMSITVDISNVKKKKELAESIISEDTDFMKKLSREDLEKLLAP